MLSPALNGNLCGQFGANGGGLTASASMWDGWDPGRNGDDIAMHTSPGLEELQEEVVTPKTAVQVS